MAEKVYIETTIPSYLTARPSRDLVLATRQAITQEWWEEKRHKYDLYTSNIVVVEATAGDSMAASRRIDTIKELLFINTKAQAKTLSLRILTHIPIPPKAADDALHISIATVHGMDYLLTWNFKHLVNPHNFKKLRQLCADAGYTMPEICTPEGLG